MQEAIMVDQRIVSRRQCRRAFRAFTLTELLVVIGIIAVLIGILLPVLAGARRQSNLVRCAANLKQLREATYLRGHETKGYMPLAGNLVPSPGYDTGSDPNALSRALGDNSRARYVYVIDQTTSKQRVAPFSAAIAQQLGVKDLDTNNYAAVDQAIRDYTRPIVQMFTCPASDTRDYPDRGTGACIFVQGLEPGTMISDYVINEGVFGYHYDAKYAGRRYGGLYSKIREPSRVMLFSDGKPAPHQADGTGQNWLTWTPKLDRATGNPPPEPTSVSLGDVLAGTGTGTPMGSDKENFDTKRHRGKMNIVFADGHVEGLAITAEDLRLVYLLPQ
jgi:prepilin-type processing-associated H-X9-DG protein/prepilin-type N-terminal cleavage/methylation domain-containing protein